MAANDPLASEIAVSSVVPSGLLPTGTLGVTVVPIPAMWDALYANPNGNTGMYRPLVGTDSVGMFTVIKDTTGAAFFTSGNPGQVAVTSLPALAAGTNTIGNVGVTSLPALAAGTNAIGSVTQNGTTLQAAGKATCSSTDADVAVTFNHISLKNLDSTNEIVVTVDEASTGTPTKPIYLEAGEAFEDYISGSALHYSAATGSPILKYVLR